MFNCQKQNDFMFLGICRLMRLNHTAVKHFKIFRFFVDDGYFLGSHAVHDGIAARPLATR